MANKALATRQRMQFRVEPSQAGRHLTQHHATKLASGTGHSERNRKSKSKSETQAKGEG